MREAVGHTRRSSFVRPGLCWRWEETVNVAVNGRGPKQRTDDETSKKKRRLWISGKHRGPKILITASINLDIAMLSKSKVVKVKNISCNSLLAIQKCFYMTYTVIINHLQYIMNFNCNFPRNNH